MRSRSATMLSLALMLALSSCAGSQTGSSDDPASVAASATATSPSPSASVEQELDPECEAAFLAGLEARDAEPITYLDPALFACETIAQFSATSRAYPDAIDIPMAAFFSNRCQANEENLATPLCSEVNPHD